MTDIGYPWTLVVGAFPGDSSVEVRLGVAHYGDTVDDQAIVDAVKGAVMAAGASSVSASTYSITTTHV